MKKRASSTDIAPGLRQTLRRHCWYYYTSLYNKRIEFQWTIFRIRITAIVIKTQFIHGKTSPGLLKSFDASNYYFIIILAIHHFALIKIEFNWCAAVKCDLPKYNLVDVIAKTWRVTKSTKIQSFYSIQTRSLIISLKIPIQSKCPHTMKQRNCGMRSISSQ